MSAQWKEYVMWRRPFVSIARNGCSAESLGEWRQTNLTFKGRSQAEAQRKAARFFAKAEFGPGSMLCLAVGEEPTGVTPEAN